MASASPLPNPPEVEPIANGTPNPDVEMQESNALEAQLQAAAIESIAPNTPQGPTPATAPPATTASTPAARSSPHPGATEKQQAPTQPNLHGSPTRVYLNQNVTPHLLEAMKHLVTQEPEKPLKWLSEFLAEKSREIEG